MGLGNSKKASFLLFAAVAALLTGCGKTLDFRNAEVSNNKLYEAGENEPFSGKVTNVPLGVAPVPQAGELLTIAAERTGDNSVQGLAMGSAIGMLLSNGSSDSPVVCDVEVSDGQLDGPALCTVSKTGAPLYKFAYEKQTPVGDLAIYSAKFPGKRLIEAALDGNGKLDGDSTIYDPESNETVAKIAWKEGKLEGDVRFYDKTTGALITEFSAVNGFRQGELRTYTPDGKQLLVKATYEKGSLTGPYEEYGPDGALIKKTVMQDGKDAIEEAAYRKEAEALIAAGYDNSLEMTIEIVRTWRKCIAEVKHDHPNDAEVGNVDEYCHVVTPAMAAEQKAANEAEQQKQLAWEQQQNDPVAAQADAADAADEAARQAAMAASEADAQQSN